MYTNHKRDDNRCVCVCIVRRRTQCTNTKTHIYCIILFVQTVALISVLRVYLYEIPTFRIHNIYIGITFHTYIIYVYSRRAIPFLIIVSIGSKQIKIYLFSVKIKIGSKICTQPSQWKQ